jgi:hypothetical protein
LKVQSKKWKEGSGAFFHVGALIGVFVGKKQAEVVG